MWNLKGSLDIIALENDYMSFTFSNEEDQNKFQSIAKFISNIGLFLESW